MAYEQLVRELVMDGLSERSARRIAALIGGTVQVHKAPFAFDTPGLATGFDAVFTDGYTPAVDDYLLNAWVQVDQAFDGTTPKATASTVPTTNGNAGFFATNKLPDLSVQDGGEGSGMGGHGLYTNEGPISALVADTVSRTLPGRIVRAAPFRVCVNQDGTPGSWALATSGFTPSLPVAIVAGVNDEFTYTPIATGVAETFTIAAGVYATVQACATAMNAAVGAAGERFDTLVFVDLQTFGDQSLYFSVLDGPGTAHNGDLIGSGVHDAATDLGFPPDNESIYEFTAGADPGAASGSTIGAATLVVVVARP